MVGFEKAATNPITKSSLQSPNSAKTRLSHCSILKLAQGDPTVFEHYWRNLGDKCTMVISGSDSMSYLSDMANICWFMETKLADKIRNLHIEVGNAISNDRHIVIGTGSTQLYQAALYALSSPDETEPISVVSAAPYYSQYPPETDYLRSRLYKWAGDAYKFDNDGPYIEVVNSPNNPDGTMREAVIMNQGEGRLIHDLAYYWPQYTPITHLADHDIMLFTLSKCTGHAGSRIGWALVKDAEVSRKMTNFIEFNSIGVSKESQLRAAKILGIICDGCQDFGSNKSDSNFFEYAQRLMAERWEMLRDAVKRSEVFSLPEYPIDFCNFTGDFTTTNPAFAWLECKDGVDCEKLLTEQNVIVRGGKQFGAYEKYARVSMLSGDDTFNLLLERLSEIKGVLITNGNHI